WVHLSVYCVYSFCACSRLAYYNIHGLIERNGRQYYVGLPVTYSAIIFPALYLMLVYLQFNGALSGVVVAFVFLGTAILFVLSIPMPKPTRNWAIPVVCLSLLLAFALLRLSSIRFPT